MTKGAQPDMVPDKDEIAAWLMTARQVPVLRANAWALFLTGLPWKYIRPISDITINSHQVHPRPVVEQALKASGDRKFKAAARAHLKRMAAPVGN